MTAHTPGPWAVWPMGRILAITCTGRSKPHPSEGMHVAAVHMPEHNTQHDELWHANARLIAAAPDLLAVVQELEESSGYWSEYDVPLGIVDRLRAAIAKAKGESA